MKSLECIVRTIAAEHGLIVRVSEDEAYIVQEDEDASVVWALPILWESLKTVQDVRRWVAAIMQQHGCHRSETICGLSVGYIEDALSEIG